MGGAELMEPTIGPYITCARDLLVRSGNAAGHPCLESVMIDFIKFTVLR